MDEVELDSNRDAKSPAFSRGSEIEAPGKLKMRGKS